MWIKKWIVFTENMLGDVKWKILFLIAIVFTNTNNYGVDLEYTIIIALKNLLERSKLHKDYPTW